MSVLHFSHIPLIQSAKPLHSIYNLSTGAVIVYNKEEPSGVGVVGVGVVDSYLPIQYPLII